MTIAAQSLEFAHSVTVDFALLLDPTKAVSRGYQVDNLPMTVLIDRNGTVRYVLRDYSAASADSVPAAAACSAERMIGTNMLQPTAIRPAPAGRTARAPRAAVAVSLLAALWALALALAAPPAAAPAAAAPAATPPPTSPPPTSIAAPAAPTPAAAAPAGPKRAADTRGLDQDIQGLKKDVVDLNKDLFVLEEELLFPANTQVAVFLSDGRRRFLRARLGAAEDRSEGSDQLPVHAARGRGAAQGRRAAPVRRQSEGRPARAGGVLQRQGARTIVAYKRGASLRFEKGVGAKYLELKIDDRQRKLQPEFEIKDWE